MKPLDFFREPEVLRVLERAARCAAVPVSVHFVERGEESPRILGFGRCAACKHMAGLPGAAAACRKSRAGTAAAVLQIGAPAPFLCHMGFACVSAPALPETDLGFVLTFGPYCPAEGAEALAADAMHALARWGSADVRPLCLEELHVVPAAAIPGIAEWTVEALAALWWNAPESHEEHEEAAAPEFAAGPRHKARPHEPAADPYNAAAIAAALAGGDPKQARDLLEAALAETRPGEREKSAAGRARVVAVVSSVMEAASGAGLDTQICWTDFPNFFDTVCRAQSEAQLSEAALGLLGRLRRKVVREIDSSLGYAELNQILLARLTSGITLNEVAAQLGQNPTAITHRLQRKFGMSFSEYVGRMRVEKAKEILRRTKLSVTEVARRVGVGDVSNFGKLFRKFEGLSPLDYREKYGKTP